MDLEFIITEILFWLIMIPAIFFNKMGLAYEEMSILLFLFFWILLIWLLFMLFKGVKYSIHFQARAQLSANKQIHRA